MGDSQYFSKDPHARLDFGIDWAEKWLGSLPLIEGDTLTTSSWAADSDAVDLDDGAHADGLTKVWVSGGTVGTVVTVTNHIATAGGREDDRSIFITIEER